LTVDYGQDAHTAQWLCPQQQAWGLGPHQKVTPGLAEKLCFTAAATPSFEQAAAVAGRWMTRSSIGRCSRRASGLSGKPKPG
jgi:hypothetical protein